MRLYLTGYMGCGKSSIGRKVARRSGVSFFDTDSMVEAAEQAEVADIIIYEGEEHFRWQEHAALLATEAETDAVVSTGGGLPVWGDNMSEIRRLGYSVYLRRSPENIVSRLSPYGRHKRPKFRGLNDEQLLAFIRENLAGREPVYMQADRVVECDAMSDESVVELLVKMMNKKL